MLRFTKRADYGLMASPYIPVHDDVGAVSANRIADEFGIPPELLAKILQRLAKRRLIMSQSGPKGGYALSRHPSKITVGEVIRALEGPTSRRGDAALLHREIRSSREPEPSLRVGSRGRRGRRAGEGRAPHRRA